MFVFPAITWSLAKAGSLLVVGMAPKLVVVGLFVSGQMTVEVCWYFVWSRRT